MRPLLAGLIGFMLGLGYGAGGYVLFKDGTSICWRSGCDDPDYRHRDQPKAGS